MNLDGCRYFSNEEISRTSDLGNTLLTTSIIWGLDNLPSGNPTLKLLHSSTISRSVNCCWNKKALKYFPCYVQVFSTDLSVCEFTFGIFFDLFLLLRSSSLNNHIFFWLNDHRIYEIFQFLRYFRFIAGLFVSSLLPGWLNHVLSASRSLKEAKLPPPTPKFLAALFVLFPVCPIVLIIF